MKVMKWILGVMLCVIVSAVGFLFVSKIFITDIANSKNAVVLVVGETARGAISGTGVIDGQRVITCDHLVGTGMVFVALNDKSALIPCDVVYRSEYTDIAILMPSEILPQFSWDKTTVKIGDNVLSIGNTYGMYKLVHKGIVSGKDTDSICDALLLDMPVGHGSSGSPVFKGNKLVGIVNAMRSDTIAKMIPIQLVP